MTNVLNRNNVTVIGKGTKPLVFANGFIGDQNLWRLVTPAFFDDYDIILFDYVGSGRSDPKAYDAKKYSRLEGYAQDVIDVCEALNLRNAILVGHSVGSMIGIIASIARPEFFSKMVLVGPSPCYINEGAYFGGFEKKDVDDLFVKLEDDYTAWAKDLAPSVMNAPSHPELSQELVNDLLTRDQKAAKRFASATFFADYRKDLLKFKIPSLIVQCSEDLMVPREVADYLHIHLHDSTLKILNAKGHFPQLSAPKELTKVIKEYLN
jgi:sigma-B regulation protein RsbQ